jgi:acyl-CoA thioester hydrolase
MNAADTPPTIDLTDREAFAFWTRDNVRFSDVDRYAHINNIAIATYCETGRVEFAETLWPGATSGSGAGWVIVRLTVTFRTQAHYPGNVEIGTRVERVGRSSCTLGQGLFKDGVCFATADSVLVWVNLADGGTPAPIPAALASRLRGEATEPEATA